MTPGSESRSKTPAPRLSFTNKVSASNKVPRQINRNLIFNQIRTQQPISRADLARSSGLQRSTVSLIVEQLLSEEWIVEGAMGILPRGRRPTFLNVNGRRGVMALDIHPSQTTVAVTDLGGKIIARERIPLPEDPEKVIPAIVNAIVTTIAAHGERSFDGIGISLPGRLKGGGSAEATAAEPDGPIFAPNVRWPIAQIKSSVEQATGLRVVADNVANACALSEVWFGDSDGTRDLVVVNVSEGLGTGIFANGRILRGEGGSAGEFGHVQVDPDGLACNCGSHGCWETLAANPAGLRYYADAACQPAPQLTTLSFEELLARTDAGDTAAVNAIERMSRALGRGMRMIAAALAPSEIVVVGDITSAWHFAGPIIEAELRNGPLASQPRLRPAQDGNTARLRSAVALVMHETPL